MKHPKKVLREQSFLKMGQTTKQNYMIVQTAKVVTILKRGSGQITIVYFLS